MTGLTVTAVYSDGTEKEITADCEISGYDPQKTGEQPIKVTYENITRFFTVTVTEKEEPAPEPTLTGIEVTAPTKTEYTQGEKLDLTGLTVTAVYSDGTSREITEGYEVTGYDANMTGEQTITITYGGMTAEFTVTVAEKEEPTDPEQPEDPGSARKSG